MKKLLSTLAIGLAFGFSSLGGLAVSNSIEEAKPMQTVTVESKTIEGIKVRTNNETEMNPKTNQIGNLWQQVHSQMGERLATGAMAYGVYHHYESDATGDYDVLAGLAADDAPQADLQTVQIQAGEYLVFTKEGAMPQAVIDAWGDVWAYFSAADSPFERAYTTDFELYTGPSTVEVYIAVK